MNINTRNKEKVEESINGIKTHGQLVNLNNKCVENLLKINCISNPTPSAFMIMDSKAFVSVIENEWQTENRYLTDAHKDNPVTVFIKDSDENGNDVVYIVILPSEKYIDNLSDFIANQGNRNNIALVQIEHDGSQRNIKGQGNKDYFDKTMKLYLETILNESFNIIDFDKSMDDDNDVQLSPTWEG